MFPSSTRLLRRDPLAGWGFTKAARNTCRRSVKTWARHWFPLRALGLGRLGLGPRGPRSRAYHRAGHTHCWARSTWYIPETNHQRLAKALLLSVLTRSRLRATVGQGGRSILKSTSTSDCTWFTTITAATPHRSSPRSCVDLPVSSHNVR